MRARGLFFAAARFALTTVGGLLSVATSEDCFWHFRQVCIEILDDVRKEKKGKMQHPICKSLRHIGGIYSIYVWHLNSRFRSHKIAVLLAGADTAF